MSALTAAAQVHLPVVERPEAPFDVAALRADFPALSQEVNGKPLVYLDNAASSQTPKVVVDALVRAYTRDRANIHRGVHLLSQRATEAYEHARERVRAFLGAEDAREIVFTRGTTEAINLVAWTLGQSEVKRGDEVLITALEHHSNIVPWQMLCERTGAKLKVAPIDELGQVKLPEYEALLSERTRIVSMAHVSNALGTVNPVERMSALAKARGAYVLVDGAQAAPHTRVDVKELGCDFYALSAHKLYGPTGVGVLYGKLELLERMPPWQGGGDMIRSVTWDQTTYNEVPHKFEAGTPDITGVIALASALDYIDGIGMARIAAWESDLLGYALAQLARVDGLSFIGGAASRASVVSFELFDIHPHDVGTICDQEGVAIRTGHHCAQPVMDFFGVPATARASFAFYNTPDDVDALVRALWRCIEVMR